MLQHTLQRIAGIAQLLHLMIERDNLIIQGADELFLVLDVLTDQLQLVHGCALIFLGLFEHFVGLLDLRLQFLLFFLQILHAVGVAE